MCLPQRLSDPALRSLAVLAGTDATSSQTASGAVSIVAVAQSDSALKPLAVAVANATLLPGTTFNMASDGGPYLPDLGRCFSGETLLL